MHLVTEYKQMSNPEIKRQQRFFLCTKIVNLTFAKIPLVVSRLWLRRAGVLPFQIHN